MEPNTNIAFLKFMFRKIFFFSFSTHYMPTIAVGLMSGLLQNQSKTLPDFSRLACTKSAGFLDSY